MSGHDWGLLASLCILGAMSPGPSLLVVLSEAWRGGRLAGVCAALSHGLGIGLYAFAAALGLSALLAWPWVFDGLMWLGAAFLLHMAWRLWWAPAMSLPADEEHKHQTRSLREAATSGFLVAFLNPKTGVFFVAVFSQFVSAHGDLADKLGMAVMAALIDASWYSLMAVLASVSVVANGCQRYSVVVQRLFALLLVAVAVRVVLG